MPPTEWVANRPVERRPLLQMAMRAAVTNTTGHLYHLLLRRPLTTTTTAAAAAAPADHTLGEYINSICRILSDNRSPHNDITRQITPFLQTLTPPLLSQILKRAKSLPFPSLNLFSLAKHHSPAFQPSLENYSILVSILGCNKQFPLMWDLVMEMRGCEGVGLSSGVFRVVFREYCRAGMPKEAVRAFDRMREYGVRPNVDDFDHLLYLLCKRRFVKEAQALFDRVRKEEVGEGIEVGVKSWSILIRGWGEVVDVGAARRVFEELTGTGGCVVDVEVYNCFLEALCKGGYVEEAYRLFREMGSKGVKPDAGTYGLFIRAYCEGDDVHSAFRVLDRMRRYELVLNVYTYNCMVKKLCMDEKVEEAYLVLDEMITMGVSPDVWSYNTILAFHCQHCEVNRALSLVSKMEKEKCLPDRHTYNMLLKMLIRVGRFDRVQEVWHRMEEKVFFPSVSSYAVMIHGLLKKKGKLDEACKYFEIMVDEGIPPYTSTCESLRNRLVGKGLLSQVEVLVGKMERSTSCSIQELAKLMGGERTKRRPTEGECSDLSEDERHMKSNSKWVAKWNRD
ncbi:hypothetical protein Droror1_Dr00009588 [Drosera rotundifolia]